MIATPTFSGGWPIADFYCVTYEDAIELHDIVLEHGGLPGVLNDDSLRSALARPYFGYYDTLEEQVTALLTAMIGNHPFMDGNKRTAVALTLFKIDASGYQLNAKDEELEELAVGVAEGWVHFDYVLDWFKGRIQPYSRSRPRSR